MNWKKFKEEKPPEGEEVLAYHPSWIDDDNGVPMMYYIGYEDIIGIELIKTE